MLEPHECVNWGIIAYEAHFLLYLCCVSAGNWPKQITQLVYRSRHIQGFWFAFGELFESLITDASQERISSLQVFSQRFSGLYGLPFFLTDMWFVNICQVPSVLLHQTFFREPLNHWLTSSLTCRQKLCQKLLKPSLTLPVFASFWTWCLINVTRSVGVGFIDWKPVICCWAWLWLQEQHWATLNTQQKIAL